MFARASHRPSASWNEVSNFFEGSATSAKSFVHSASITNNELFHSDSFMFSWIPIDPISTRKFPFNIRVLGLSYSRNTTSTRTVFSIHGHTMVVELLVAMQ